MEKAIDDKEGKCRLVESARQRYKAGRDILPRQRIVGVGSSGFSLKR